MDRLDAPLCMRLGCKHSAKMAAKDKRIAELEEVLRWYQRQLCEGDGECVGDFCGVLPDDDCCGCRAFRALHAKP